MQIQVDPETREILAYGYFSAAPEGVDLIEVDDSEIEKFSSLGQKMWVGSTIIVNPPLPPDKEQVADEKVADIFESALERSQEIVPEVKGDYGRISPDKMYAFVNALAIWMANRAAKDLGAPHDDSLNMAFLGLLSSFRAKRDEVKSMREDPNATAEDIQQIDPSV